MLWAFLLQDGMCSCRRYGRDAGLCGSESVVGLSAVRVMRRCREDPYPLPDAACMSGRSARKGPYSRIRIRYRQPLQNGTLYVTPKGGYIVFDTPQRGVTAGQFAAWYDGDELIGSGVIHR